MRTRWPRWQVAVTRFGDVQSSPEPQQPHTGIEKNPADTDFAHDTVKVEILIPEEDVHEIGTSQALSWLERIGHCHRRFRSVGDWWWWLVVRLGATR